MLRRPLDWFGIGLGLAVFSFLSRGMLLKVADFASAVMFRFDRRGRRLALANLRVIHPVANAPEGPTARELLVMRRSYRNMARTVAYAFWTCRGARERAQAAGEMDAASREFLARNRPAVTVSGHLGCWEILSQLAFLEGHSMMSVAKDIGSAGMTSLLMRARRSIGQEIVHADGAFRPLMQGIRAGKSLGLLVDQVVKPKNGGIWVWFLGRPMPVSAAPAFFAAKAKAPIIVAWSRPLRDGRWRCEMIAEHSADEARDVRGVTQKCLLDLERVVRRHPSCWVLNYNYFRKTPSAEELAKLQKESR